MIDDANGEAKNAAALPTSSAKEQEASYFDLDSLFYLMLICTHDKNNPFTIAHELKRH